MAAHLLRDTTHLTRRTLAHVTRSPDTIITTAIMPLAIMLLFVYVFGGAIRAGMPGGTAAYVGYLLPGILIMTATMGISYTSYRLFIDLDKGIVDRFTSMPIARSAILWAHVLTSMLANVVSLAIVVGVGFALGFRSHASAGAWLAVAGLVLLLVLALSWLAVIAGLSATSVEGASAFAYPLIFLPFVSSAFVPTSTMPGPVRWFADHQPVTTIVDTLRSLLDGRPVGSDLWPALGWCAGIAVAGYLVASLLYRRRIG